MKSFQINRLKRGFGLGFLFSCFVLTGCEEELPAAGSIPDKTLPKANFSYKANVDDFRIVEFTNLSESASNFMWDFGGETSEEKNPSFTFNDEGTYPVSLTVTDGNNVSSDTTIHVEVVDLLIPEFACPSFEECDSDREVWGKYSGSGSPTPPHGSIAAKLNGGSTSDILEQTIKVGKGKKYKISFYYVGDTGDEGINVGNLLIADGNDNSIVYFEEPVLSTGNKSEYKQVFYMVENGGEGVVSDQLLLRVTPGEKTGRFDLFEIVKIN